MKRRFASIFVLTAMVTPLHAGEADVIDARAEWQDDGRLRVTATLRHGDEGWDHYADRFEVLTADGSVLATRELAHPHVHEQPFTRSSGAFDVPEGISVLTVRARDSRHGFGGAEFTLDIAAPDGASTEGI